jgi:quercetin dioxygenase-like cupin family protein
VIRQRIPSILAALLVGLVPLGAVRAQSATPGPLAGPPGPVTHFPTHFLIADAPEQFDQVLMVIDFQPGSWTPPHMPGGNVYNTVIEGAISIRPMGNTSATTYEAGATFVASAGEYVEVGNSGDVSARMISTTVLPKGATLTTYADVNVEPYRSVVDSYHLQDLFVPPPRPTIVGVGSVDVEGSATALELVQMLVEFEPGMWTATHRHGGYDLSMVATGAVTLERRGEVESFASGESLVNTPGLFHRVGNESEGYAQVAVTFLLPIGAILTTVQPAEAPVLSEPG